MVIHYVHRTQAIFPLRPSKRLSSSFLEAPSTTAPCLSSCSLRTGVVAYFACPDVTPVNEYRHEEGGITRLFVQPEGSRLVFEDDQNKLFLFNPVNDQVGWAKARCIMP